MADARKKFVMNISPTESFQIEMRQLKNIEVWSVKLSIKLGGWGSGASSCPQTKLPISFTAPRSVIIWATLRVLLIPCEP